MSFIFVFIQYIMSDFVPQLKSQSFQGNIYYGFDVDFLQKNAAENTAITYDTYSVGDKHFIVLHNVFTGNECDEIIRCSELCEFEDLTHVYSADYRKNTRVMMDDIPFATTWYRRIIPILTSELGVVAETDFCLNPRLRISKYVKSGFFAPHYDTPVEYNDMTSNYTVIAYLNDVSENDGGSTRFYRNNSDNDIDTDFTPICIHPRNGSVVVFAHDIGHDGEELYGNEKYVIRTELMRPM